MALLNGVTAPGVQWGVDNVGVGGTHAADWAAVINSTLSNQPLNHITVLYPIGVNDFGNATEAQWIADMQTTIDAMHNRWPSALIYIVYPWKRGFDATADIYAGWVDQVVASRSFVRLGLDERVWLKGSDDGATNTYDGIHISVAGQAACAALWKTLLGF